MNEKSEADDRFRAKRQNQGLGVRSPMYQVFWNTLIKDEGDLYLAFYNEWENR